MTPVELVCFHHAGGGSASFLPLRRALAALGARILEDVTLERI
jgi:surfactin synthase thioesterase subunit